MTGFIIVQTATSSKENANKIIAALLAKKLIACAQISKVESYYIWDAKTQNEPELKVDFKAKAKDYIDIEKTILDNHSYETPEIISFDIDKGSKAYLNWISDVTR